MISSILRKLAQNILLASISLLVTIGAAELFLRWALFNQNDGFDAIRKPQLYADYERDGTEHLYQEDYWKLRFLFNEPAAVKEPHPHLGWIGNFDGGSYEHADEYFSKGKRPVLLFGDSFSQCIDSTTCFEEHLNNDSAFAAGYYLLNFGVGGYGVDQIHLLTEQVLNRFEDPIVIFGMLTTDLDRSMLQFRDGPKPFFHIEDGTLKLSGTPLELNAKEYVQQNPVEIRSHVLQVFKNGLTWLFDAGCSSESREAILTLNKKIIERQLNLLRSRGIQPLVLLFEPIGRHTADWRATFLKEIFRENGIKVIEAKKALYEDMKVHDRSEEQYFIPIDLHPNSYYNGIVAKELKKQVLMTE